jgi:hypothetical protein
MKHDYTLLSSLLLCLPLVACGGGEDDDGGGTPTTHADTDAATGSETGDDTSDPTTTASTTTASTTDDPTTGPTTDPDSTDTGETGDDTDNETGDETGGDALSFDTHVWPIIDANCSCHKSNTPSGGLDMRALAAYASLVDTPSVHDPNTLRVAPGMPDQSFLFQKLTDTHAANLGNSMPPSGALPQTNIDIIEQWIADGAEP